MKPLAPTSISTIQRRLGMSYSFLVRPFCLSVMVTVLGCLAPSHCAAEELLPDLSIAAGELQVVPSFEACSYYFRLPKGAENLTPRVEFRSEESTVWQSVFPPISDSPPGIWKGSIFNLREDHAWQVRVLDAGGVELIAPVKFRTWSSTPVIAKVVDLSRLPGAGAGIVVTDQGTAGGWIKYTAPRGWRLEREVRPGDELPAAITVRNASYVIFENLTVIGGSRYGISIEDSESIRVLNCDISGWGRLGVQQFTNDDKRGKYVDASGALINLDGGIAIFRSRNTVVERNYVHDPRGRANSWQFGHPTGPTAVLAHTTRGGTVLRWNDFVGSDEHRWNDVVESASNASPSGGFYRDSDISGNFLAFGNDDGIELEGGGMNVRFYRNKVEGTLCGVSTGACFLGPQFIYGNLFANPGDETGLALYFFKNSHGKPQSGKRHHINNTLFGTAASIYGGYGKPVGNERIGFMRNNIFVANAARPPGEASRRDDFNGDQFWIQQDAGISEAFLAGLRHLGQESRGQVGDPRFRDAPGGDFRLTGGSEGRNAALEVPNLVAAGAHRGAFMDESVELPFRPLALQATPRQLNFSRRLPQSDRSLAATQKVTLTLPIGSETPVEFEIRKNAVFSWFTVTPASGVVSPGENVVLTVTLDSSRMVGRPVFRGAFLVRTPSGLSRPVSVYAATEFSEDLRPAAAPDTVFVEASAVPSLSELVRTSDMPSVVGKRYVQFSGLETEPELRASFVIPRTGHYSLLLRASYGGDVTKARELLVSIDDGVPERAMVNTDYQWNAGATHFRAVYLRALGELSAGRHEIRLKAKDEIKINELILTTTPSPFLVDGWHESTARK